MTHTGARTVPLFQTLPQLQKHFGQLPVAVHVRVIQRGRTTLQSDQVVQRIKHLIAGLITSLVRGHDRVLMHDLNTIDVTFHRHCLERAVTRDAVAHLVEPGEVILVDLRCLANTRIEAVCW